MVFTVLFGSRLMPQAAQRFARRAAAPASACLVRRAPALVPQSATFASQATNLRPSTAALLAGGLRTKGQVQGLDLTARAYGTRSLWNVKRGKFWLFCWVVP